MMIGKIDSLTNPKIKHIVKLLDSSKERKQNKEFVLEGLRLCLDCVENSSIKAESVFFTAKAYEKYNKEISSMISFVSAFEITEAIANKIARTESSQGVFLLCEMKDFSSFELDYSGKYIALDNLQNPDNFGAICRSAEALGISGIITSSGVDMYNPKALRAAMGSSLRLDVIKTDNLCIFLEECKSNGMKIFATVPDSKAEKITEADLSGGVIAVIGNEGNGVSDAVKSISKQLTIPMAGKAESLNAATAAAITIWELMR